MRDERFLALGCALRRAGGRFLLSGDLANRGDLGLDDAQKLRGLARRKISGIDHAEADHPFAPPQLCNLNPIHKKLLPKSETTP